MGKHKKKKEKARRNGSSASPDLEAEIARLREDNQALRARLGKIAELSSGLPGEQMPGDDEDDEYDELTRDVDDEIADDEAARAARERRQS